MSRATIASTAVSTREADLTKELVDAILNAANEQLAHGGGLAAAIVRAGGRRIQDESDRWVDLHGPLRPGIAAVTGAGAMPARFVIHVAGPRHHKGQDNEGLLRTAVHAALNAAAAAGCRSVALPAISAGIFGYPLADATRVIASECVVWAREHEDELDEIRLVGYDPQSAAAFDRGLAQATRARR